MVTLEISENKPSAYLYISNRQLVDHLMFSSCLQMQMLRETATAKNKLLNSVAAGGVEQLNQLQSKWDKYDLMLESHELMIKGQVIQGLNSFAYS